MVHIEIFRYYKVMADPQLIDKKQESGLNIFTAFKIPGKDAFLFSPLNFFLFVFLALNFLWLFSGCSLGPKMLKQGHLSYNTSVKATSDEELLLNIVRLRYLDTIEFLATNSISAQTSLNVAIGARFTTDGAATGNLVIPELSFSDRPTFTFTPQRGKEFAKRLTEPVDIDIFSYLAASDWPINLLLILLGSEINGIINEPGGNAAEFNTAARILLEMQSKNDLLIGFVERQEIVSSPIDGDLVSAGDLLSAAKSGYQFLPAPLPGQYVLTKKTPQPVMWVRLENDNGRSLKQLLRLKLNCQPPFDILAGAGLYRREMDYQSIVLRTRSLLGAIVYLSQAVNPPEDHIKKGFTTKQWPLPGDKTTDILKVFNVLSSKDRPAASLAVEYRNYWFYIDETDMASKAAFLVLSEFYRLAISEGMPGQIPILTLPVGAP